MAHAHADGASDLPLGPLATSEALFGWTSAPSCVASADAVGRLAACSCMHDAMIGGSSFGHSSGTLHTAGLLLACTSHPALTTPTWLTHLHGNAQLVSYSQFIARVPGAEAG